jgi:flagellum-specific peptidoglycan hydrolase FlgJ
MALKQAEVETGNFTSAIFKENNNLFGHRHHPSGWKGVEMKPTNRGHLMFAHWTDCVVHHKLWQKANYNEKTYARFLKRIGYAEDPNYIAKLITN